MIQLNVLDTSVYRFQDSWVIKTPVAALLVLQEAPGCFNKQLL